MTETGQRYDLEELAAFIDGRLAGDRKAAVERRLVLDDDYYELYREAASLADEQRAEEGSTAAVIEHPQPAAADSAGPKRRVWWLPAAALAAAAIAAIWLLPSMSDRSFDSGQVIAELSGAGTMAERFGGELWSSVGWSVHRSAAAESLPRLSNEQRAFRLGVRTVDLTVALRSGDQREAAALAFQIEALLELDEFAIAEQAAFAGLRRTLQAGRQVAQQEAAQAEHFLRDNLTEAERAHFETGQWAELGRLAARSRTEGLFHSREWRAHLDRVERMELTPEVRGGVEAVAATIEAAPLDYESVDRGLEPLFASLGG